MGQQQLLLLVLGIVIVGLAVVIGIEAFAENQHKSEVDRYTEVGVAMAGDLIAYHMKPEATGGGGQDAAHLGTVTVGDLGYEQMFADTYAGYTRTGTQSAGIRRDLMMDTEHPAIHVTTYPLNTGDTRVEVYVFGPKSECIVARNDQVGDATWSDGGDDATAPDNPSPANCSW